MHHGSMPDLTIKVDATDYVANRRELESRQLPFAMAKTLTSVAQDGQAELRRNASRAFKLRNSWTIQGIRFKPADARPTNGRIEADVHTDTANRQTGAPDYLVRQDEGGEKVPFGGRQYLAVPTKYLRQMCPGIIPDEMRPRNLLGLTALRGRYSTRNRKGQIAIRNQRVTRGLVFFMQKLKGGDMAIMGRYVTDRDAYPYYILIHSANIRKSQLDAETTVEKVVSERFQRHWDETWRTLYGNGLRL